MPPATPALFITLLSAAAAIVCLALLFLGRPRAAGARTSTSTPLDLFWALAPFVFLALLIALAYLEAQR